MAAVAALALVAGSAHAQDAQVAQVAQAPSTTDAGWNTKYGLLFTLPNLLQNGGSDVVNDYAGAVGFQYNLAPQTALRLSADLTRTSAGITETKYPTYTVKSVPASTSFYGVTLRGEYMMRMSTAALSPYAGVGAFLGLTQDARNGTAVDALGNRTAYDNYDRTYAFGALGKLGLEWRIHKVISFFAEYQASLTLIGGSSGQDKTRYNGVLTTDTSSSEKHFASLGTGIANFGQLGVAAFF
jgi:hypothetical protein